MTLLLVRMVTERFHRDVEDRPIRESRTPPELLRADDIEYRSCPYAGARHGKPMNASALRQTSAHWDEVIDALAWLRAAHGGAAEVRDVWRVSQLGSALPWWFILRGEPVPAYAAALAKATLGMGIWAQRVIVRSISEAWRPPSPLTSHAILELAEANGTLLGLTEVCSAGDKMLLKFFDVLVGEPQPAIGAGEVARLVSSRDAVLRFGRAYIGFKQIMWIYFLARRFLYADVAAMRGETPELRTLLDGWCEPPDFFTIEPPNLAAIPPVARGLWFRQLAMLCAGDAAWTEFHARIATAMGDGRAPVATFHELDTIFGDAAAFAESGLRDEPFAGPIDAATRDQLLPLPPRAMFDALA